MKTRNLPEQTESANLGSLHADVVPSKPNWSEICKRSRAKKAAKGLCVWCGKNPEGEASGLCEPCREKCNLRNRSRERRKLGIPENLPKLKPWGYKNANRHNDPSSATGGD